MVSGSVVKMEDRSRPMPEIISYQLGAEEKSVQLESDGEVMRIATTDRIYEVRMIHSRAGELTFTVDGIQHTAFMADDRATRYVAIEGDVFELRRPTLRRARRRQHHGADSLIASMPGQVTKVLVSDGDVVPRGQPLLVLEAMKMEIKIAAPHDGRVAKVLVKPGQVVDRGQELIEMSEEQSHSAALR